MLEKIFALINGTEKFSWDAVVTAIVDYLKDLFGFVYGKLDIE